MNALELKIGNRVMKNSIVVTVDGRTIFDIDAYEKHGVTNTGYSPIKLTEQWAERHAVAINSKAGDTTYEFEYSNGMLFLRFNEGKAYWLANKFMPVDLPYVHLWQNLFFYLTQGEELKI